MKKPTDWRALIGHLILLKSKINDLDPDYMDKYTVPRVAAVEAEIVMAEVAIGTRLPLDYREFLLCADGWPYFHWITDLFGTVELCGDGDSAAIAKEAIAVLETEGIFEQLGIDQGDLIPIGAGVGSEELLVLVKSFDSKLGEVLIWVDGGEVELYENFSGFFSAIIGMHQTMLDEIIENQSTSSSA